MMRVGSNVLPWRRQFGNGALFAVTLVAAAFWLLRVLLDWRDAAADGSDAVDTALLWCGTALAVVWIALAVICGIAWRSRWGVLHVIMAGDTVVLGNPFLLALGRRPRFAHGETVTVVERGVPGTGIGPIRLTLRGAKSRVNVSAHGEWGDAQRQQLRHALAGVGLVAVDAPGVG